MRISENKPILPTLRKDAVAASDSSPVDTVESPYKDRGLGMKVVAGHKLPVMPATTGAKVALGVCAASGAWIAHNIISQVAGQPTLTGIATSAALAAGAAVGSYVAADFASGIFHHTLDNYIKPSHKVLGEMASDFQAHHYFANSMELGTPVGHTDPMAKFLAPAMVGLAVCNPHYAFSAGALAFLSGALVGQISHRFTHQAHPPAGIETLRRLGIAQEQRGHLEHHLPPWVTNYCVLNGSMNPLLDRTHFWRKWEKGVYQITGLESKAWAHPAVRDFSLGKINEAEYQHRLKAEVPAFKEAIGYDQEKEQARQFLMAKGR